MLERTKRVLRTMTPGQGQITNAIRETVVFMDNVNQLIIEVEEKHDYTEARRIVVEDLTNKADDLHERGVITTATWDKLENHLNNINRQLKISAGPDIETIAREMDSLKHVVESDMVDDVATYVRSPKAVGTGRRVTE